MHRAGKRFIWAAAAVAVATLFVASGFAQVNESDPRNTSDDYFDAVNGGKCFAHHGGEGFQPFGFGIVQDYSQFPIGEVVPLKIRLRHNSQIASEIHQISVVVDTTKAQHVKVITPDTVNNTERTVPVTLSTQESAHKEKWSVLDGASEMYVGARVAGEPLGAAVGAGQGQLNLNVFNPTGRELNVKGEQYYKFVKVSGEELRDIGTGDFMLNAAWESQLEEEMDVELTVMVNYTQTQTEFIFRAPEGTMIRTAEDPPVDIEIPIVVESAESGVIDFRIQAVAFYAHNPTDGAPRDDGLYYRFMQMTVRGGDQLIPMNSAFGPQPVGVAVDLYNLFTRILGFVAALLIPLSMLTGGIFGKKSRRWFNKVTGGAKKRVLWHSAMSWMIIGVASFHFLLALIEVKFVWTKGLLWGGLGWALLISLGFTGYYQVRMIKRWNYKVWRHTHLWSAVAVLGFTLIHLTVDGSDLQGVRDALPGWVERLSWP